jgi:hypothetical protein
VGIRRLLQTHKITTRYLNPTISGTQVVSPYTTRATGVSCRIVPGGGSRWPTVLGKYPKATHRMWCLASVTLNEGDEVMDEATNVRYAVASIEKYYGIRLAHHIECVLEQKTVST